MSKKLKKGVINGLVWLAIITVTLELSPFVIYPVLYKGSFSRSSIQEELFDKADSSAFLQDTSATKDSTEYLGEHILHPYLGFVSVPRSDYNRFCLPGADPILKRADNRVNICLTGGSVAQFLYENSAGRLAETLKKESVFNGKEIHITAFTLGGYKQPQQLLALNYFLSLGAEYDIVINLDGFNEVALPYGNNLKHGIFPSYPRHWNVYSRKRLDSRVQLHLARQLFVKEEREDMRKWFSASVLRHSNFCLLLWKALDNKKNVALFDIEEELGKALESSEADYQTTGPQYVMPDTAQYFSQLVEIWSRSSNLMDALVQAKGGVYFHFLQPNQYYEGSKELTAEELAVAYHPGPMHYKIAVRHAYGMLVEEGKSLAAAGENYTDLTLLFKNEKQSIYTDQCCHVNQAGYNMIADRIAKVISSHFEKKGNK